MLHQAMTTLPPLTKDLIRGALENLEAENSRPKTATKKERVLNLYHQGVTDVAAIGCQTQTPPSYVAQVLRQAGLLTGYFDLYTSTDAEQNVYSRFFRHVLTYKNLEAAKKSVDRIDSLYKYFEEIGDRAGQHQAMVIALTGKNRARWSGKHEEAAIFHEWLIAR